MNEERILLYFLTLLTYEWHPKVSLYPLNSNAQQCIDPSKYPMVDLNVREAKIGKKINP